MGNHGCGYAAVMTEPETEELEEPGQDAAAEPAQEITRRLVEDVRKLEERN